MTLDLIIPIDVLCDEHLFTKPALLNSAYNHRLCHYDTYPAILSGTLQHCNRIFYTLCAHETLPCLTSCPVILLMRIAVLNSAYNDAMIFLHTAGADHRDAELDDDRAGPGERAEEAILQLRQLQGVQLGPSCCLPSCESLFSRYQKTLDS